MNGLLILAVSLATTLAFNVSLASAQVAIDPGSTTGVVVEQEKKRLVITKVLAGSPAAADGILSAGDEIVKLSGKEAERLGEEEANAALAPPHGTKVQIEAKKQSGKVVVIELESRFLKHDRQVIEDIEKEVLGK